MTYKLGIFILMMILGHHKMVAQHYLGIGWHLGAPVRFDNCCNPYFQAKPIPISTYSLTYKREITNKRKHKWYYEMGLTSAGLGYRIVEHDNDTTGITPWGLFSEVHHGFPSVLFGFGRTIALKNKHEFVLGLEGSCRISYTMRGMISTAFSLEYTQELAPFPIFLRANLGYAVPLKLFGQIPSHLLFYTKISAQNMARGPQYIRDPITHITNRDGEFTLNNSEAGIQFYFDLGKQHYNFLDKPKKERKPRVKRTGKSKVKFSLEHQIYAMRLMKYYLPMVDSFSLTGDRLNVTSQIGLQAEFVHFKNSDWSTVVAVGTGMIWENHQFSATPAYTQNGTGVAPVPGGGIIGRYLIQNIGLAYKHDFGKKRLQHTFSLSAVEPIEKYAHEYSLVDRAGTGVTVEGKFYERYGHNKFLLGVEYSPELLLHLHKRVFFGLGMVFNYSWGTLAQGRPSPMAQLPIMAGCFSGSVKLGLRQGSVFKAGTVH